MRDTTSRLFALLVALVGVWIVTYWLYQPGPPRTTRDDRPAHVPVERNSPVPGPDSHGTPPAGQDLPQAQTPPGDSEQAPPLPPPPVPGPQQVLIPPKFREYIVERGDTGWGIIAEKTLNDRRLWKAVSQSNPLVTPNRLIPGRTVLKIPLDPDNIQGKLVTITPPQVPAPTPPNAAPAQPESTPPPAPPLTPSDSGYKDYTIQDGDTLWNIAKKFYGKGSLWPTIFEANRDVIKDSDSPTTGVKIRIPPLP